MLKWPDKKLNPTDFCQIFKRRRTENHATFGIKNMYLILENTLNAAKNHFLQMILPLCIVERHRWCNNQLNNGKASHFKAKTWP
jgi:hypothetical protein